MVDHAESILLVRPTYKWFWDLPGGMVEPGESPTQACAREVHEEIGVRRAVGRLLVVDWAPHPVEGDKVLWVFECAPVLWPLRELVPDHEEVAELRWVPLDDMDRMMPLRLSRRIRLAVQARTGGTTLYAEHGREMGAAGLIPRSR